MEATFSGVATLVESASGHYDRVSDAKAEFGTILGASINKCVKEITMKAAMKSESLMEKMGSGTPLKDAVEKDFAESGDTVYLEDFKFEVKKESLELLEKMKAEAVQKKAAKAEAEKSKKVDSTAQPMGMNPAMLVGMGMANQMMNPNTNMNANPNPNMNVPQNAPKFCTSCGAKRIGNGKFCTECGAPF